MGSICSSSSNKVSDVHPTNTVTSKIPVTNPKTNQIISNTNNISINDSKKNQKSSVLVSDKKKDDNTTVTKDKQINDNIIVTKDKEDR